VETHRDPGKRQIKLFVVPGQLIFTHASECLRVREQPIRNALALHSTPPVKWMNKVREREFPYPSHHMNLELQPEMGVWSPALMRPAEK
jgi:hypothetical protein